AGVNTALIVAAVLVLAVLTLTHLLRHPWSIDFTMTAEPDSVPVAVMNIVHNLLYRPEPKDGPVLVAIEFQVDRSRGSKFVALMREVRLIHLRNGAYSWQLLEDPSRLNTFRIEMMVPSWTQYMLQQERMTKADGDVIAQAESLHVGPNPPEVRTYLGVNKELLSHKHRDATTIDSRPEGVIAESVLKRTLSGIEKCWARIPQWPEVILEWPCDRAFVAAVARSECTHRPITSALRPVSRPY